MKLTKWTPVAPTDTVFDRLNWGFPVIDRLINDALHPQTDEWSALRVPRTNIQETPEAFIFTMEMPGVTKSEVEVALEGETLIVRGGTAKKTEAKDGKDLVRREFRETSFERTFTVGRDVNRDGVKAKMEHGILTVTVPKAEHQLGRKVDVD